MSRTDSIIKVVTQVLRKHEKELDDPGCLIETIQLVVKLKGNGSLKIIYRTEESSSYPPSP